MQIRSLSEILHASLIYDRLSLRKIILSALDGANWFRFLWSRRRPSRIIVHLQQTSLERSATGAQRSQHGGIGMRSPTTSVEGRPCGKDEGWLSRPPTHCAWCFLVRRSGCSTARPRYQICPRWTAWTVQRQTGLLARTRLEEQRQWQRRVPCNRSSPAWRGPARPVRRNNKGYKGSR